MVDLLPPGEGVLEHRLRAEENPVGADLADELSHAIRRILDSRDVGGNSVRADGPMLRPYSVVG